MAFLCLGEKITRPLGIFNILKQQDAKTYIVHSYFFHYFKQR